MGVQPAGLDYRGASWNRMGEAGNLDSNAMMLRVGYIRHPNLQLDEVRVARERVNLNTLHRPP